MSFIAPVVFFAGCENHGRKDMLIYKQDILERSIGEKHKFLYLTNTGE